MKRNEKMGRTRWELWNQKLLVFAFSPFPTISGGSCSLKNNKGEKLIFGTCSPPSHELINSHAPLEITITMRKPPPKWTKIISLSYILPQKKKGATEPHKMTPFFYSVMMILPRLSLCISSRDILLWYCVTHKYHHVSMMMNNAFYHLTLSPACAIIDTILAKVWKDIIHLRHHSHDINIHVDLYLYLYLSIHTPT